MLFCSVSLNINNLGPAYPTSWLSDRLSRYHSAYVHVTLILLNNNLCVHSGNLNITQRSDKVFPLCEKVTVLKLLRIKKKVC